MMYKFNRKNPNLFRIINGNTEYLFAEEWWECESDDIEYTLNIHNIPVKMRQNYSKSKVFDSVVKELFYKELLDDK